MMTGFLHREAKMKQSERLMRISREARRIREEHEAGRLTAAEAAKELSKLRSDSNSYLERTAREHSAA